MSVNISRTQHVERTYVLNTNKLLAHQFPNEIETQSEHTATLLPELVVVTENIFDSLVAGLFL